MERVTIDGLDIRIHRGGSGEPLLYLHSGLGEVGRTPFVVVLEERYEVLAPELPGFGGSDPPRWHRVEDAVFFLRRLLDHFAWPPAHAVGSSLGAWLAAELAVWFPERFRSLVLFDPVGINVEGEPIADVFMASRSALVEQMFVNMPDPLDDAFGEAVEASDGNVVLHFYKALEATARIGWNPYFHDPQLRPRLSGCQVPVTVVRGDGDGVITHGYAQAYAASFPSGRLATIDGVGHVPVVEAPRPAAAAVFEALSAVAA